jgi:ArsR family transcriptional regulator
MTEIADFLRVLADETRLTMLWLLSNHAEICVCDLMEALGITQSKASRHLATLRHAGLVSDRREGTWSYYSMRPVEGQLESALLKTLQTGLARRASAATALRRLQVAVEGRCRHDSAAEGGARKLRKARKQPTIVRGMGTAGAQR